MAGERDENETPVPELGRHPRDCVLCGRLQAALIEVLEMRSVAAVLPEHVERAAGLPSGSFAEHYPDLGACGEAAFEREVRAYCRICEEAFARPGELPERSRAAVMGILGRLAAHPGGVRAWFELVDRDDDTLIVARSTDLLARLVATFERRFTDVGLPRLHVEFVVAVIYAELRHEIGDRRLAPSVIASAVAAMAPRLAEVAVNLQPREPWLSGG